MQSEEALLPNESALRLNRSTADLIADVLRDEIIGGAIAPCQQLLQDEIAARLGVSKIPVREALRTLEAEGFVASAPRRGTIATQISVGEVSEAFEIRLALEPLLARLSIRRMSDEHIVKATRALQALERESDERRWGKAHWDFHLALYEPAEHPVMVRILSTIHHHIDRFLRQRMQFGEADYNAAKSEHEQLLKAFIGRKEERACRMLARHIRGAERTFVAYARQHHSTGE